MPCGMSMTADPGDDRVTYAHELIAQTKVRDG
jgi:hypothetical protein